MARTLLSQRNISCAILVLLSLLPLLALAAPAGQKLQQRQSQDPIPADEECGFGGDDNTYGLGIRIGVYLQWITSAIAYGFIPSEAQSVRGVNNCFQAAMFAGLIFITVDQGPKLHAVEAYIMLIFCMGGVCSGDTKDDGGIFKAKRFAYYNASNTGGIIRFALSMGFCVYGLWFFFVGMDGMRHTQCTTWAFFFAKVNLYTWLRTFMKIIFVFMGVLHAIIIFWPMASLLCYGTCILPPSSNDELDMLEEIRQIQRPAEEQKEGEQKEEEQKLKEESGFESTSMVVLSGSLISFILTVELMIKWNHIRGVNQLGSTGQLLPLIVAVGSFLRVLHLLKKERYGKPRPRSLDSRLST